MSRSAFDSSQIYSEKLTSFEATGGVDAGAFTLLLRSIIDFIFSLSLYFYMNTYDVNISGSPGLVLRLEPTGPREPCSHHVARINCHFSRHFCRALCLHRWSRISSPAVSMRFSTHLSAFLMRRCMWCAPRLEISNPVVWAALLCSTAVLHHDLEWSASTYIRPSPKR